MQKRSFLLLLGATVIAVAVAIFALVSGDHYVSAAPAGTRALPQLAAHLDDVASVTIKRHDMALTFVRHGDTWLVPAKYDYPAATGRIRQIVLALAEMDLVEPKTARPALYSRLEVGAPDKGKSALVTLKDKTGHTLGALIIGKPRFGALGGGNDAVYVRRPNQAQSWLASGAIDCNGNVQSWLERRIIDISTVKIAAATLTQPDGSSLAIDRKSPDGKFVVEGVPANAKLKDQTAIAQPAAALEALDLDDVRPAAQLPVPASGVTSADYRTFAGLDLKVQLFEHDKKNWITVHASGTGKAAPQAKRLDARLSPWVFAIPQFKADLMRTGLAQLLQAPKGS